MPAKKPASQTVTLSGEQSVRTIAEAHTALRKALTEADTIMLDASGVDDADLTFVQLIESTRLTAASLGKRVCLKTPFPPALNEQLERGGFLAAPVSFWKNQ